MTGFDGVFISEVFAIAICVVQIIPRRRKIHEYVIFGCGTGALILLLVVTCYYAYSLGWKSSILGIAEGFVRENKDVVVGRLSDAEIKTIASVKMDNAVAENVPQMYINDSVIYSNQDYYEVTWYRFKNYETYTVYVNEVVDDFFEELCEYEVEGCSFLLDTSMFHAGHMYSINISADKKFFSMPIRIEMDIIE